MKLIFSQLTALFALLFVFGCGQEKPSETAKKPETGEIIKAPYSVTKPQQDPKATNNVVTMGKARFTVLTAHIIRMEYDSTEQFCDAPSQVFLHRNTGYKNYEINQTDTKLTIKTPALTLTYQPDGQRFSQSNLSVELMQVGTNTVWYPGLQDTANLKGTTRTLDGFLGNKRLPWGKNSVADLVTHPLEPGLVSKSGWVLVNDSLSYLFDSTDWAWVQPRPNPKATDWYFFGHGNQYTKALQDFTTIAGRIPMPPRYAFGYWWSRYWNYSDSEIRDLVKEHQTYGVPLDVMVIDMDWHTTDSLSRNFPKKDEFGQQKGWTGYSWNLELFPEPEKLFDFCAKNNLKTALNLHPASGIAPWEAQYGAMAKAIGFDTTTGKNIPYMGANKQWAQAYFKHVLHPIEAQGNDFWWLDWQQWKFSKQLPNLNNTWWLNYLHFTDQQRQTDNRGILFHRWGGLGNHRYQVGFSGDAIIHWESLQYQPYFTATASNVGYGYWSHDIGGHFFRLVSEEEKVIDPEMYLRWLQFGIYSPIVRTHSSADPRIDRRLWLFGDKYFPMLKQCILDRYAMVPYLYNCARIAYETGVSLIRPMYYHQPNEPEAYGFKDQYYFGPDLVVAPIVHPSHPVTKLSSKKIWLPKGKWYDVYRGELLQGNQTIEKTYSLNQVPLFAQAGAIIPKYQPVNNLQGQLSNYILTLMPSGNDTIHLYNDNGDNEQYREGKFTSTQITRVQGPKSETLTINPSQGSFEGKHTHRNYIVELPHTLMPDSVVLNGKTLNPSAVSYEGTNLTTLINIETLNTDQKAVIEIYWNSPLNSQYDLLNSKKQQMALGRKAYLFLKPRFKAVEKAPLPKFVTRAGEVGQYLTYQPHNAKSLIKGFEKDLLLLKTQVRTAVYQLQEEDYNYVEQLLNYKAK